MGIFLIKNFFIILFLGIKASIIIIEKTVLSINNDDIKFLKCCWYYYWDYAKQGTLQINPNLFLINI